MRVRQDAHLAALTSDIGALGRSPNGSSSPALPGGILTPKLAQERCHVMQLHVIQLTTGKSCHSSHVTGVRVDQGASPTDFLVFCSLMLGTGG